MTDPSNKPQERYRGLFDAAKEHLKSDSPADDPDGPAVDDFLDRLRKSGLLDEKGWSTAVSDSQSAEDARDLAGQLLNQGRLTAWQCRMLLAGRTSFRIGDYELLSGLGAGGMGVVYKARQVSLDRVVALKMIRSAEFASAEEMKRFQLEAEAVAQLDHPRIVPVFEVGEWDGQPFFSMAFVEGQSLKEQLADGPLPNSEAAELIRNIAEGVAYANARGVIHRDLKPGNILIDGDGQPRITDFGLAKRTASDSDVTKTGQAVGTPSYMPPEQALGKADLIGPTSDVYSLGAVLYCVLTGRPPFQAASAIETLRQVVLNEPIAPRSLNRAIDGDLETICLKCLHKDPQQRYANAKFLAEDLTRYLNGEPIHARPAGTIERGWRWVKRRPIAAGLLFVSVLAFAAFASAVVFLVLNRELSDSLDAEAAARRLADASQQAEKSARQDEEKQRKRAETALDLLKYSVYNNDILAAERAFRDGERARSLALLNGTATDRRGWEWRFLRNRFDTQLMSFRSENDSVAFSPDGRWIAGSSELIPVLRDAKTGVVVRKMQGFRERIEAIRFSDNGTRLIAAGSTHLAVWNVADGRLIRKLPFQTRAFHRLDIDPHRGVVLLGTLGRFTCRRVETGRIIFNQPEPGIAYMHDVNFSSDGRRFLAVVITRDGKTAVEIRSGVTGRLEFRLPATSSATSGAINPDGTEIVTGTGDGRIEVWDIATKTQKYAFHGLSYPIHRVRFSPDGGMIAASGGNERMREVGIWLNTVGGPVVSKLPRTEGMRPELIFSPDGRRLAVPDATKTLLIDATGETSPLDLGGNRVFVDDCAFFSNNRRVAAITHTLSRGRPDYTIGTWKLDQPSQPVLLQGAAGNSTRIAVSPDGKRVVTSGDKTIPPKIWHAATGRLLRTIAVQTKPVQSISFSSNGQLLATTSLVSTVVWETSTGRRLRELSGNHRRFEHARFLPAGNGLLVTRVTTKAGRTLIEIVDGATGQQRRRLPVDPAIVADLSKVAVSPDGKRFAVADSRRVAIISAEDGRLIVAMRGATRNVKRITFSPDGRRLATSDYKTVRLWDTRTGRELIRIARDSESPVSFSRDGRWLAVGLQLFDGAAKPQTAVESRVEFHRRTALRWHLRLAKSHQSAGNWYTAAFQSEQAARLLPDRPLLRINAGRMYANHGHFEVARGQYQLALNSGKPISQETRAHFLAEVGRYDDALQVYSRLVSKPNCSTETRRGYAMVLLAIGREAQYRRVVQQMFTSPTPPNQPDHSFPSAATAVVRPGVKVDAARLLNIARQEALANRKSAAARITLGAAYYRTGDDRRAIAVLESALKLPFGEWPEAYLYLTLACKRSGQSTKARDYFRRALRLIESPPPKYVAVPTWIRRTTIRCLRREALDAVGPAVANRP